MRNFRFNLYIHVNFDHKKEFSYKLEIYKHCKCKHVSLGSFSNKYILLLIDNTFQPDIEKNKLFRADLFSIT